jgi:hypothetical protein
MSGDLRQRRDERSIGGARTLLDQYVAGARQSRSAAPFRNVHTDLCEQLRRVGAGWQREREPDEISVAFERRFLE